MKKLDLIRLRTNTTLFAWGKTTSAVAPRAKTDGSYVYYRNYGCLCFAVLKKVRS